VGGIAPVERAAGLCPPVQLFVAALRRGAPAAALPPPAPPESDDPAARQAALEWEAWQQERAAAHARAAQRRDALLTRLGEGHALLVSHTGNLSFHETVRAMRGAEDGLRRAMAARPAPGQLAGVRAP